MLLSCILSKKILLDVNSDEDEYRKISKSMWCGLRFEQGYEDLKRKKGCMYLKKVFVVITAESQTHP